MRRMFFVATGLIVASGAACSFLLDFDELQQRPPDAGLAGSSATGGADSGGSAGSNSGGSGGMPEGIPLDALAPAMAQAVCANITACYKSAADLLIHDEDCETLFTKVLSQQTVAPIQTSVEQGTLTYDPLAGAACFATLVEGTTKMPPDCSDFNAIIEDCKIAFTGLAALDGACNHRFECDKGLFCDLESGCPGTCRRFAEAGATCLDGNDCDPLQGLYCRKVRDPDAGTTDAGAAMTGTCSEYLALGAACAANDDQCVPGAFCIGGTCRRVSNVFTLPEGERCYTSGFLCDEGLACEFGGIPFLSDGTCVAERPSPEACTLALPGACTKGNYCSASGFSFSGTCLAAPVENQACASATEQNAGLSAPCAATLACVNGLCKPMRDLGQACEAHNQCYSGACFDAVCVPPACPAE